MDNNVTMDKIVSLCKSRGIIFQGSEIYGGMGNTWDFGPVGVEIKNNIKKAWHKTFVQKNDNAFFLDSAILMNSKVWEASGHVQSFSDPKMDCKKCKTRHRADNLIEEYCNKKNIDLAVDTLSNEQMQQFIDEHKINCPHCGNFDWTAIRQFKLMFETKRGVVDDANDVVYLRPETAQGEFVNFLNVQRTMRAKVPFAIAQVGKAFRNEITPGNFIFRTIEFEQMELQQFCKEQDSQNFYEQYKQKSLNFLHSIGLDEDKLRFKDHDKLAHYAKAACDIQYKYPMGWSELNGIHNRSNYDLSRHQEFSGKSMLYTDPITNEKYIPNVVEYSIGADRLMLAVLCNSYMEEKLENETRVVLKISPALAAYKVAVFPLMKKLHSEKAKQIYDNLSNYFMCDYDDSGSIGKRYRRQDEIGTLLCITVDDETLNNNTITIRNRDTMEQETICVDDAFRYINEKTFY